MTNCPKKCPYKKDGICRIIVPSRGGNIFLSLETQCPYYETTVLSSQVHAIKVSKTII